MSEGSSFGNAGECGGVPAGAIIEGLETTAVGSMAGSHNSYLEGVHTPATLPLLSVSIENWIWKGRDFLGLWQLMGLFF